MILRAIGESAGALMTGSLKDAHQAGLSGLALGAGIGALAGGVSAYKAAKSQGLNPWSGKHLKYPTNDGGVLGTGKDVVLEPGTRIDRYGEVTGNYAAPEGTPLGQRSLSPRTNTNIYNSYEVVKPLPAYQSVSKPYFLQQGGGVQYKFEFNMFDLIKKGYIK